MVDRPFWDNSFFKIQVEKDRLRRPGSCINGQRTFDRNPFPVDPTDEELLDWLDRVEVSFQVNLAKGVLGDLIPEIAEMTDEEILELTQRFDFE